MNARYFKWILLCVACFAVVWLFWPRHVARTGQLQPATTAAKPVATVVQVGNPSASLYVHSGAASNSVTGSLKNTNRFAFRLTNTTKSLAQLSHDAHAILLANALIDTRAALNFSIPKNLQAKGDPGAYIVQANGSITAGFRQMVAASGAQIISYIPNNAYLVQASAVQAAAIQSSGLSGTVLPYEPYYKVASGLLAQAATQQPLPVDTLLNVGAFASQGAAVEKQIESLGGIILAQDISPFGPIYRVSPPADWTALAQLPGVQVVEPTYRRRVANDLSRVTLGVSLDTITPTNYLNLYGKNVLVNVNDTGIDATHPDFSLTGTAEIPGTVPPSRITGDSMGSLVDPDGHGTLVAGIIAGNGSESYTVTNTPSGSVTNADFRGKASLAELFSIGFQNGGDTAYNTAVESTLTDISDVSDYYLQTTPALTNALISNNSWTYAGNNTYDLAAASYDAAVRDALPMVTGSQPVLFVFAAGNNGGGNDDGAGGNADTVESPGTAKNVITVGALEQYRNITNQVTDAFGNSAAIWLTGTDSGTQVASYSSRGNVGVGVEGDYGRFKPDLVAPGTFVVSTLSKQWNPNAYYNPTNYQTQDYPDQLVDTNGLNYYNVSVPPNAVGVVVQVFANAQSPVPFPPNMPMYVEQANFPDPVNNPSTIDFTTTNNVVAIPPDSGGNIQNLQSVQGNGFWVAVGDGTNIPVNYNLTVTILTTNDLGNYFQVLSNLNAGLAPWYRYESGTSIATPSVSGVLALIQDFFTNTLQTTPSPALLKALAINGARPTGGNEFAVATLPNLQGWGLVNLPNSLPAAWAAPLQTTAPAPGGGGGSFAPGTNAFFFQDQSPTNALATGDSTTFTMVMSPDAQAQPLRVTLTWTDPPGDPNAAIKLVNNLDIIVTNLDTLDVYYGNNFSTAGYPPYSLAAGTNEPPSLDVVNNVKNIYLQPALGTNYSVTVLGRSVNVNAVTAQTNNVVQDYALVISSGDGFSGVTNAFTIVAGPHVTNPTGDQTVTFVVTTNAPLMNQIAGENTPLLGTNSVVGVSTNSTLASKSVVTLGMTNQWHFYVVTNTTIYTNAAFLTFFPYEMATPRMGTLAASPADAVRSEGDIDLYVASEASLTNLDPLVISNCINGIGGDSVSAGQGGTEFVAYSNSVQGQVYYIGVKSEDHLAVNYGFLPVFSQNPFSKMNPDGSQSVYGLTLPITIPDGSPQYPGTALVFALALYPMTINEVIETNGIWHQNYGDLVGQLSHANVNDILNSHDGLGDTFGAAPITYYDAINNPINTPIGPVSILNARPSDGPGSLVNFQGKQAVGPWILQEVDNAPTHTGSVETFGLRIYPHVPADKGLSVWIEGQSTFNDYVDVPAGVTNFTLSVTNFTLPTTQPPLLLYLKFGAQPTPQPYATDYDQMVGCSNGIPPGGSVSVTPTSLPPIQPGRYYYEIYNPSLQPATNVYIIASFGYSAVSGTANFQSGGIVSLQDDAVVTNTIVITNTDNIYSAAVGVVLNHPRVSDLTLTLLDPTGQRYVLFENRGGPEAQNLGHLNITTNFFGTALPGTSLGSTNVIGPVPRQGILIVNYDFYQVPDNMDVYYGGVKIFSSGYISYAGQFVIPYGPGTDTNITIIMDQGGDPNAGSLWTYTPSVVLENYTYLAFTDDTNLADILIKFALPPFNLNDLGTNYTLCNFELVTNGDFVAPTNIFDAYGGWTVPTNLPGLGTNVITLTNNEVSVVTDPATAYDGSNYLALANGTITRLLTTIPNRQYSVSYAYRGPGIAGWWRGEGDAADSAYPETNGNNGQLIGRFNFPAGEVGQAFQMADLGHNYQFAGTNNYVQVPQSTGLDVGAGGGLTVEGWINPTNLYTQEPLVEWLARVPTNTDVTKIVILGGPFLNRSTSHFYYLLGSTNWVASEQWATNMGGHLVTINDANEQNWVYDTFGNYGGTNRNLWLGLNNAFSKSGFTWISGQATNYFNWRTGQPNNLAGDNYAMMLGASNSTPGLWINAANNGTTNGGPANTNVFGVVEVDELQPNGVQLWVSVTNSPATGAGLLTGSGCLYANLVDTTNGIHEIYSAPGLVQSNVFQHVALTYNTNSGVATLYYDGTNVCSTNLGVFTPKTTGDVLLGKDMSLLTNNFYSGEMDEMSIYGRALSDAEIAAIYNISAQSTNNNPTNGPIATLGKFNPNYNPAQSLAMALVTLDGRTNLIFGDNQNWQRVTYTFVATTNATLFQFTGLEPGMLLDDFSVSEAALGNLYYQPEEPLAGLVGESAAGNWTLEILDNRVGATNAIMSLVSWQLELVLQTNTPVPLTLYPEMPGTNTIPPGGIAYFTVPVPDWAHFATNILVSATSPVNLLFNQTTFPTGTGVGDITLLPNSTGGIGVPTMMTNGIYPANLPLYTNQTYYLGVKNISTVPSEVVVRVDYDITALTNSAPLTATLDTNETERYFSYDVGTNAYEATFQLLKLSANANLVASYGTPLPALNHSDYGSYNGSNADQSIYIQTNSTPVPLTPGRWYLGVFRTGPGPVTYSVLAKELDTPMPNVITLTNNVPFNFTTGPGAALTNFFLFNVTNSAQNVHFQLYNLTGNADLTVQTNGLPLVPPFYQSSQEPGGEAEYVYLRTNSAVTNLNAQWYLGVPSHEITNISFTILAVIDTNAQPAFPGAVGAGGNATGGRASTNTYHVTNLADDGPGSLRYGVNTLTNAGNIVFDVSGNIPLQSPLLITNSNLTISGQTAPGDGITLQNYQTVVSGAQNVIVRFLRFRPGNVPAAPVFSDNFGGPPLNSIWQASLPTPARSAAYGGSSITTYLGPPQYGFQTLGTNTVLRLTNILNNMQRRGWSTTSSFTSSNFDYDVRFNTLVQSGTTSIDAFIEIWIIDAANSSRYDLVSPFGGSYSTSKSFWAGSSIDGGSGYLVGFNYTNNAWYHLVLKGSGSQNIRASITDDNGVELVGTSLAHTSAAFPSGIRLGLSQAVGYPVTPYPVDVAVSGVKLTAATSSVGAGDSLVLNNAYNVMVDHVSASWATNADLEVLNSSNVTVQWSLITDSLYSNNVQPEPGSLLMPGQGSSLRYGSGVLSFNHNLYANNYIASPVVGDNLGLDFVNNIVYNWGLMAGQSVSNNAALYRSGSTNRLNYAANYFLSSTNSRTNYIAFWGASTNTWIFQTNNFIDAYTNREIAGSNTIFILNGSDTGWGMFTNHYTPFGNPFTLPPPTGANTTFQTVPAEEAYQAYERVLDFSGAQASRDRVDLTTITHLRTQSGQFISSPSQAGGWPGLSSQPAPLDTDQDGLPDYWEITFGTNPTNAADGAKLVGNTGYTELEMYLNWLAAPHALTTQASPVSVDLYQVAGGTGRLSFFVTNALNGFVYLTNNVITTYYATNGIYTNSTVIRSNSLAVFTPTNNYTSSFTNPASFDFYVTNNDTVAYIGPVTVSVVVSAASLTYSPVVVTLTNGVPYTVTNAAPGSIPADVFGFNTTNSPGAIVFQLYALTGSATLVVQTNGLPVAPNYLLSSSSSGTNDVQILVQTNFALTNIGSFNMSPLNAQWYLGITNGGTSPISYTIVATAIPVSPTIINLTNGVPYTYTAGPGPDLTNFFRFTVTNSPNSVQFQLYNQSGNGDLTYQTNALPFAPVYAGISQQPGNNPESIQTSTNVSPASQNALYYLGVPNNDPAPITYTILAQEFTNVPPITIPTNAPQTNVVGGFSTNFYLVNVPANADWVTNTLLFSTGPLNVWFSTNTPPTVGLANDALLLASATNGLNVFGTTASNQLVGSAQLVPGSFYYLGLANTNSKPVTNAIEVDFHLVPFTISAPSVTTLPATNLVANGGTLEASVIPNGAATRVWFAYGLTTNYGSVTPGILITNSLFSTWPVAAGIGGLQPGTTYHYQAIATNSVGTNYGLDVTFTTPPAPPTVVTMAASIIGTSGALLNASVTPNGATSTVWFAYGTNTSYGSLTASAQLTTNLNTPQPVALTASGLLPGVLYHFRAVGTNSAGTNYGADLTFKTTALPPSIATLPATNITATSATLPAVVTPNGAATLVWFAYGATTNYDSYSTTNALNNNLNLAQTTAIDVTNLSPGQVYHFQAFAANSAGLAAGGDLTFTNLLAAPTVVTLPATNVPPGLPILNAMVTPNGTPATVYFAFGVANRYLGSTPPVLLTNNLTSPQLVSTPLPGLLPGVVYYCQAIAGNLAGTNYGAVLTFTNPIQPVDLSSILAANLGGTNGYLLSWYAPPNYQFNVQWLAPLNATNWQTFTNLVAYSGPPSPTNVLFTFFDDGSQTGGLGSSRFYRLREVLPIVNTQPPQFPTNGAVYLVTPLSTLVVTNTATDINTNAILTYTVTGTLTGTNQPVVGANTGIIAWTPTLAQAGLTNTITTVVTDDGAIQLSSTNTFTVIVTPIPYISSVQVFAEGVVLQWTAAANSQFQLGWTTNLLTPWVYVPTNAPYLTSSTTNFIYVDTNTVTSQKFYQLRQLP